MSDSNSQTARLHDCVDRWRAGDTLAADELLRATARRLEQLARRMLRDFPSLRPAADTLDVYQGSVMRLLNSLKTVKPETMRDYYRLSALQIRRELLDLARQASGKPRRAAGDDREAVDGAPDTAADDYADLDLWCRFHQAVEKLPAEEREAFGLSYYHGWPQSQVAEMFGVSERTVRRWWVGACARLRDELGGKLPGAAG